MALRRCCRFAAVVPKLRWSGTVVPGGQSAILRSSIYAPPGCRSKELLFCGFSSESQNSDVSYEQMKQLLAGHQAVVIDVREPWELREYGFIPGSINVPLAQVNTALQLAPEDFKEKYGGEMPQHTDNIVFTCLAGIRSKTALDTANTLGFKEAQHYPGGWKDWVKHEQHN